MNVVAKDTRSRARGAMYGQIIGDNLGAIVEFETPASIRELYPDGVREMGGGGPFNVAPGQATDDSELALALARSIVRCGKYDEEDARASYKRWAASSPPDIGYTCVAALCPPYELNVESKANGALMRVSPIAIAYAECPSAARTAAEKDAMLTHPNEYVVDINGIYTEALASIIAGEEPKAALQAASSPLAKEVETYLDALPEDVASHSIGFVRYAFNIACYFAAHGRNFEDDLVAIIGMGGDTDTNGAIAGAMLGAKYGEEGIPLRWRHVVDAYRTEHADRPEEFSVEGALARVDELPVNPLLPWERG